VVSLNNGQRDAAIDDEAAALRDLYFADCDNIVVKHLPNAQYSFLIWQAGVVEPEMISCNGSKPFEVERFHLMYFASTRAELIEKLETSH